MDLILAENITGQVREQLAADTFCQQSPQLYQLLKLAKPAIQSEERLTPFPQLVLQAFAQKLIDKNSACMQITPVQLQIDQSAIYLQQAAELTEKEWQLLSDEITPLLDEIKMHALQPDSALWILPEMIDLKVHAVADVLGRNVHSFLPRDKNHSSWARLFTEISMCLQSSQLNQQRREQGLATVDALWFGEIGQSSQKELTENSLWLIDEPQSINYSILLKELSEKKIKQLNICFAQGPQLSIETPLPFFSRLFGTSVKQLKKMFIIKES